MLQIIRGQTPAGLLLVPRLDIWHNRNKVLRTLPEGLEEKSLSEILESLGLGLHSVVPDFIRSAPEEDIIHRSLGFYNNPEFPYRVDFSAVTFDVEKIDMMLKDCCSEAHFRQFIRALIRDAKPYHNLTDATPVGLALPPSRRGIVPLRRDAGRAGRRGKPPPTSLRSCERIGNSTAVEADRPPECAENRPFAGVEGGGPPPPRILSHLLTHYSTAAACAGGEV